MPQAFGVSNRSRRFDRSRSPSGRLFHPPLLPRSLGRKDECSHRTLRFIFAFEYLDGRFCFLESAIDLTGHPVGLSKEQPCFSLSGSRTVPFFVQKLQRGLCGMGGLFCAECIQSVLSEPKSVLDSFVGNVALREMINQSRVHPFEPAAMSFLNLLSVFAMTR